MVNFASQPGGKSPSDKFPTMTFIHMIMPTPIPKYLNFIFDLWCFMVTALLERPGAQGLCELLL